MGEEPGNLPLLEFALTLMWEQLDEGWFTHAAYENIGRVEGALARYAEKIYAGLDDDEQEKDEIKRAVLMKNISLLRYPNILVNNRVIIFGTGV